MKPTLVIAATLLLLASGCTAPTSSAQCEPKANLQDIKIDGSSTVYPVAQAWAEEYAACAGLRPAVAFSGTGGGFQKFCRGETQVSDASRPIKSSERAECEKNGIHPFEIQVAIDGLAVVVPTSNTFVDHLSVTELNRMWTQNVTKQANRWSEVRDGWPNEPIKLFGPGTNSGTFDYFIEVIIHPFDGSSTKGRSDYTPSEDDNVLVQGVEGNTYALGYFGLAYARENADKLRIVPILQDTKDGGKTHIQDAQPVEPSETNVVSGKYAPLSRPLFMYTDGKPTGAMAEWLSYGLSPEGQDVVAEVGYVRLNEAVREQQLALVS